MKDCVLALDLGTTGNRAVVFDRELKVVARSYREFPQFFPEPGWVEHDPERIWTTALACLEEALKAAGRGRVAAYHLCNLSGGVARRREFQRSGLCDYGALIHRNRIDGLSAILLRRTRKGQRHPGE